MKNIQILKSSIVLFTLAMFLMSCATREGYEKKLISWVGSSEDKLIDEWGKPVTIYESSEGEKELLYIYSIQRYSYTTLPGFGHVPNVTIPIPTRTVQCRTTFVIKNGVVRDWGYDGPCAARE